MIEELFTKLENWTWSSAVVGLGYVGLPLVVTQSRAGVPVTGFDVKESVIDSLSAGRSHIDDIADDELAEIDARFTSDPAKLSEADVIFICVPTPLAVGKLPDISYIERAGETIAASLRRGQLVILESTTYPGTTEDTLRPILEKSGLKLEDDFLLAYAPERVDPANASFRTANIPRVVGGATPRSTAAAELVYRRFIEKVHPVSSARTAEMAKLLENTFRWVNIALVNEMSTIARAIGVDIWEVVDAAATKPFGFMPFYPGPGVGGHCIPLDPFYLQWAARVTGEGTRFVELAEAINSRMPQVGVAYKKNVRDFRESPAKETIGGLQQHGAVVTYSDPHVPSLRDEGIELDSVFLDERTLAAADCVLILADHDAFDHQLIARRARLVVDTRNALGRRGLRGDNVVTI